RPKPSRELFHYAAKGGDRQLGAIVGCADEDVPVGHENRCVRVLTIFGEAIEEIARTDSRISSQCPAKIGTHRYTFLPHLDQDSLVHCGQLQSDSAKFGILFSCMLLT